MLGSVGRWDAALIVAAWSVTTAVSAAAQTASASSASEGTRYELLAIHDSVEYFRYEYRIVNPVSATASVGTLVVDQYASGVAARASPDPEPDANVVRFRGTFIPLSITGPPGWTERPIHSSMVLRPPVRGFTETDSIAPGASMRVVIRSPFLPGVRPAGTSSVNGDCCSQADTLNPGRGFPMPWDHPVVSLAVLPTVAPGSMTPDILEAQLRALCRDGGWLSGDAVCRYIERWEPRRTPAALVDQVQSRERFPVGPAYGALLLLEVNAGKLVERRRP